MSINSRLRQWLRSYPQDLWILGVGSFINISGLSLLWPINTIYIHLQLGQPMTVAGLVLMLYSAAGFVGGIVSGWAYDKVGIVPVLSVGLGLSGLLICIPIFSHNFAVYVLVMLFFGMTCSMPFPALTTMAGQVMPNSGRKPFNFIYVTNNLGVALGTALGGFLAQVSFLSVFVGIAAAYFLFLVLVLTVFRKRFAKYHHRPVTSSIHKVAEEVPAHVLPKIPWLAIAVLLSGFIFSWVAYVQWQSTVSVYMQGLGYPLTLYSILWTLNGLLIFAAQPVVRIFTSRIEGLSQQMLIGVVLYVFAFIILVFSHHYYDFVAAMVMTTFGEMFAWPAVPAAIAQMAPVHRAGFLQGLGGSSATLGRMLGPVMGGFLFDRIGEHASLEFFAVWLLLPLLLFLIYSRLDRAAERPTGLV